MLIQIYFGKLFLIIVGFALHIVVDKNFYSVVGSKSSLSKSLYQ